MNERYKQHIVGLFVCIDCVCEKNCVILLLSSLCTVNRSGLIVVCFVHYAVGHLSTELTSGITTGGKRRELPPGASPERGASLRGSIFLKQYHSS